MHNENALTDQLAKIYVFLDNQTENPYYIAVYKVTLGIEKLR